MFLPAAALFVLLAAPQRAAPAVPDAGTPFLAEQLPLALSVRTPEDLAFKAAAEKQYLVFNLLAGGKLDWDRGQFESAATRWEALLRTPGLPDELRALVQPLAEAARARAGSTVAEKAPLPVPVAPAPEPEAEPEPGRRGGAPVTVSGTVEGGGPFGPGGAVVALYRTDGATPRPRATRIRSVVQRGKRFIPHVLAVPVGATVEFRNEDDIYHNVFSLSKANPFDLGQAGKGVVKERVFTEPGPVQLLCNIHSTMQAWVYVVDTPYFAQADARGKFTIKGVPEGQYKARVWHEWTTDVVSRDVKVARSMAELSIPVAGDRQPSTFSTDKSGKKVQPQLGY